MIYVARVAIEVETEPEPYKVGVEILVEDDTPEEAALDALNKCVVDMIEATGVDKNRFIQMQLDALSKNLRDVMGGA
jgi:type IV pilus biogenesis protein CpaD/CtpE